ncbi:cupin domain-containing protein [Bradyrhizobium sp. NP1]|uniref:cupin domain-containing protein n=1 Tax=Bradyrhizobium sp. NP1 TaxID=3049772 RepID=UPI0025A59EFE|nr:cupin domain-containing protein [Bradyrhizobium sp. NP1]WJR76623.1 cupin domain-containing protein [Bradyrhizobium sp. NP1]
MAVAKTRRRTGKGQELRKIAADSGSAADEIKIGLRLKHARLAKHLKLRELADRLGCSESFLSKLENDKVRPSLSMLHQIVGTLDINIAALFADPLTDAPVLIMRSDNRPVIRTDPLLQGPGIALERLIATAKGALIEANIHCVSPGGHTDGEIIHDGEEIGYVLTGELELHVAGETYHVAEGDCFFFKSDLSHGYRNPGKVMTRVLWVCTPPTF